LHSLLYVIVQCLSVCLSHTGIVLKRLNLGWLGFHGRVAKRRASFQLAVLR